MAVISEWNIKEKMSYGILILAESERWRIKFIKQKPFILISLFCLGAGLFKSDKWDMWALF